MVETTALEHELRQLIEDYRRAKAAVVQMSGRLVEQDRQLAALKQQNLELRATIDALNADRFSIKRLKDERRDIRRKVVSALERLDALEQEVYHVFEQ